MMWAAELQGFIIIIFFLKYHLQTKMYLGCNIGKLVGELVIESKMRV